MPSLPELNSPVAMARCRPASSAKPARTLGRHAILCLALCLLAALFPRAVAAESAKPHVVIILVDDMGWGDPGCYNPQSKIPTPNIDRLAREGMRFTDAHAPGAVCHPSRYGLLTGRYPFRTNVSVWPKRPTVDAGRITVPALLKAKGYRTTMVGKWHLGFLENGYDQPLPGGPVDCGFDTFFGIRASTDIPPYFYIRNDRAVAPPTEQIQPSRSPDKFWSNIQAEYWLGGGIAPGLELKDVTPRFTEEAVKTIREHAIAATQQPLMLYLAYPSPHTPWLPSAEFQGRSGAGMYGDFTMMVDAEIGRVLHALDEAKLAGETLLFFTSDNGPTWYAKDIARFGHDATAGWRGMKGDAWEGAHRMPFIVRWPGRIKAGSVTAQTICFTDLLATLAELLEVKLPPNAGEDSFSILPVLRGDQPENQPVRGPVVVPSSHGLTTIRDGAWKFIDGAGPGGFIDRKERAPAPDAPPGQLYDLSKDPGETNNLLAQHPEIAERLRKELARIRQAGRSRATPAPQDRKGATQ